MEIGCQSFALERDGCELPCGPVPERPHRREGKAVVPVTQTTASTESATRFAAAPSRRSAYTICRTSTACECFRAFAIALVAGCATCACQWQGILPWTGLAERSLCIICRAVPRYVQCMEISSATKATRAVPQTP